MERIFAEHCPDYVFHAAAYKHVPMMEDNPAIAVQNNIYGTRVIADLAVKYGTKKFVMISTDKAVNPKHVPMMEDNPAIAVQNNIYGTRVIADLAVKYGTKKFVMISTDKAVNPTNVMGMEDNPAIAVQNNIYGTRVIADLAVKYGTKKFVMISTDKAVNPTNVMGCSKRICEIYCQSLNQAIVEGKVKGCTQFVTTRFGNVLGSNGSVIPIFCSKRICEIYCQSLNQAIVEGKVKGCTQFVTTRFGNVLGSNGSVIPIFKEQIKKGEPITVTHPDIIRYFMLIPEACRLVLEAGTMGKGGEIFVFDMGRPVKIVDLAKRMIKLSGAFMLIPEACRLVLEAGTMGKGGEIFVFDMGRPVKIVDLAKRMIKLSGAQNVEIKFSGLRPGEKLYEFRRLAVWCWRPVRWARAVRSLCSTWAVR